MVDVLESSEKETLDKIQSEGEDDGRFSCADLAKVVDFSPLQTSVCFWRKVPVFKIFIPFRVVAVDWFERPQLQRRRTEETIIGEKKAIASAILRVTALSQSNCDL